MKYALSDVRNLLEIHSILETKLKESERYERYEEYLEEVTLKDLSDDLPPHDCWKKMRFLWKYNDPTTLCIIREVNPDNSDNPDNPDSSDSPDNPDNPDNSDDNP